LKINRYIGFKMLLGISYLLNSFQNLQNVPIIYIKILLFKFIQSFKINLNNHLPQWKWSNNYILYWFLFPCFNPYFFMIFLRLGYYMCHLFTHSDGWMYTCFIGISYLPNFFYVICVHYTKSWFFKMSNLFWLKIWSIWLEALSC
jgi:hypothetical protein